MSVRLANVARVPHVSPLLRHMGGRGPDPFCYSVPVRMKLSHLLILAPATWLLTSCATIAPPQPPSLDLPKPPLDLRATRKGNRVNLTWSIPILTTDRQTIRELGPTRICRTTLVMQECGTPVAEAPPAASSPKSSGQRPKESFTDTLPPELQNENPTAYATYAVEVLNRAGRGARLSNQARVLLAPTLPPPQDFHAQVTSRGVVLSWARLTIPQQVPEDIHFVIRAYRREQGSPQQTAVGEVTIANEPTLTDAEIQWQKTYEYHAEAISIVRDPNGNQAQVEGDDTPEVTVFADDVFPPTVPSGLQAVFSGPGQSPFIDLVWAPVTDADLAGYNVYRHEVGGEPVKLNSAPLKTPSYRDDHVSASKRYLYSVSTIDFRGNESARSDEASETVP